MAKAGFYEIKSVTPGHEIKKARDPRPCGGGEIRLLVDGMVCWVLANAPNCRSIRPGDFYLLHRDRRTNIDVSACIPCAIQFNLTKIEGNIARYKPVDAERLLQAKRELEVMLSNIQRAEFCSGCGISHSNPEPRGIGFLTDEMCRVCGRYTLE